MAVSKTSVASFAVLGMMLLAGSAQAASTTTASAAATTAVKAALTTWAKTISGQSAAGTDCAKVGPAMLALYGPNAIVIPTIDNVVRKTPAEIQEFFGTILCPKKPAITIVETNVRAHSSTVFSVSGIYTFDFPPGSPAASFTARYTYIYTVAAGKYKIATQHASKYV